MFDARPAPPRGAPAPCRWRARAWGGSSVADVLEEPFGRDLAPEAELLCLGVDQGADGGELQALVADIAIKGDLVVAGPARRPLSFAATVRLGATEGSSSSTIPDPFPRKIRQRVRVALTGGRANQINK